MNIKQNLPVSYTKKKVYVKKPIAYRTIKEIPYRTEKRGLSGKKAARTKLTSAEQHILAGIVESYDQYD